jgi:hypothetical protein
MINLTKSNANIQKIVAFENAFELALSIIADVSLPALSALVMP